MTYLGMLQRFGKQLLVPIAIGAFAVTIQGFVRVAFLDPLVVALVIGIVVRSTIRFDNTFVSAFGAAPSLFIPIGVIFYGAVNLDFYKFATVDTNYIFLLLVVFVAYVIAALLASNTLGLSEKVGYLITTGSAVCGASAIAITSEAIGAEPDEVSVSLIPVFIASLLGLFLVVPFVASYLDIGETSYGVFSADVLQFTGTVKAAVGNLPDGIKTTALSVKAARYVWLLVLIPLFASFVKGRFHVPWYLWAFLGAGLVFTFVPGIASILRLPCKLILNVLWSVAMAAIGLNANIKTLFTATGLKAFVASLLAFFIATGVFAIGITLM